MTTNGNDSRIEKKEQNEAQNKAQEMTGKDFHRSEVKVDVNDK